MESEGIEIGPAVQWIQPDDFRETASFKIVGFEIEETQWGKRGLFTLQDTKGDLHSINTWNLCMQKKTKFSSALIGNQIKLSPFNEKKLLLTLI